jgi:hypothetical protein
VDIGIEGSFNIQIRIPPANPAIALLPGIRGVRANWRVQEAVAAARRRKRRRRPRPASLPGTARVTSPSAGCPRLLELASRLRPLQFGRQASVLGASSLWLLAKWSWISTAGPTEETPRVQLLGEPAADVTKTIAAKVAARSASRSSLPILTPLLVIAVLRRQVNVRDPTADAIFANPASDRSSWRCATVAPGFARADLRARDRATTGVGGSRWRHWGR